MLCVFVRVCMYVRRCALRSKDGFGLSCETVSEQEASGVFGAEWRWMRCRDISQQKADRNRHRIPARPPAGNARGTPVPAPIPANPPTPASPPTPGPPMPSIDFPSVSQAGE